MTAQYPPTKGLCNQSEQVKNLFASRYAEPFDKADYLFENPQAKKDRGMVEKAEMLHTINHLAVTSQCRNVCAECPFLDECREWVLSFDEAVYGVVAGMTERERVENRDGMKVSSDHILTSTESMDVLAMSQMLLGNVFSQ